MLDDAQCTDFNIWQSIIQATNLINNAQKTEVLDPTTLQRTGTITDLNSPRFFLGVNPYTAYMTDLYADTIQIINLNTLKVK